MSGTAPPSLPKYLQVYNILHADIVSGRLGAGERLPSEAALVKTFGASRITVGRALRDLQREGFVERRAGSGTYVRYGGRRAEAGLTFGLLAPDLDQAEVLDPICRALSGAAAGRPHAVLWASTGGADPEAREAAAWALCRQYIDRKVAGVFFAPLELSPSKDACNRRIAAALDEAGIPVVLVDRSVEPYGRRESHDVVGIDNRRAGFRITDHLLTHGATRVGFVGQQNAAPTVDARLAGYREALHVHGALVPPDLVLRIERPDMCEVVDFVRRARPDALVCANDRTAALAMHALLAAGVRIPDDVRLAGLDDVEYAALLPVPLTTLRQPCREIGVAAMAAMVDRLARPDLPARDIFLHPALIVRKSCGATRADG